jgi:predicted HTH transcriptional regulator
LEQNPHMTLAELASTIGKSLSAVERACSRLVREDKLRFIGPRKNGYWEKVNMKLTETIAEGKTPVETPVEMAAKTPVKILSALEQNPRMTLTELASIIGKSLSAVERACARLVHEGKLRFVGPRKGGHWEILK